MSQDRVDATLTRLHAGIIGPGGVVALSAFILLVDSVNLLGVPRCLLVSASIWHACCQFVAGGGGRGP
jgi:hypothetical protein